MNPDMQQSGMDSASDLVDMGCRTASAEEATSASWTTAEPACEDQCNISDCTSGTDTGNPACEKTCLAGPMRHGDWAHRYAAGRRVVETRRLTAVNLDGQEVACQYSEDWYGEDSAELRVDDCYSMDWLDDDWRMEVDR
jgi:hypothetical protein